MTETAQTTRPQPPAAPLPPLPHDRRWLRNAIALGGILMALSAGLAWFGVRTTGPLAVRKPTLTVAPFAIVPAPYQEQRVDYAADPPATELRWVHPEPEPTDILLKLWMLPLPALGALLASVWLSLAPSIRLANVSQLGLLAGMTWTLGGGPLLIPQLGVPTALHGGLAFLIAGWLVALWAVREALATMSAYRAA